jgi:3' terminal RNA ribose 2'-O-methyltransferase Hen1
VLLTLTLLGAPDVPATDLGFLLHKHPDRAQSFASTGGTAHVLYPEATPGRCTAALLLEVDPVGLVRGSGRRDGRRDGQGEGFSLAQYVNDRPYAASSLLAVALGRVFRTALAGRCDARPELAARPLPLEVRVPALPCAPATGLGEPVALARRLFEPLGWDVDARVLPLDPEQPGWGDSRYVDLRLSGRVRVADALSHLYVLMPVLDDAKHYRVDPDEVDKLVRSGRGWLAAHPEAALITRRYLAHRHGLTRAALARLAEVDDTLPEQLDDAIPAEVPIEVPGPDADSSGSEPEEKISLAQRRRGAVLAVLRAEGARRIGDLGCGDGVLTADLLADPGFTQVVAADVSARALEVAARRLRLDRLPDAQRARVTLLQSSLVYRDARLAGLDAAVLMEVVEHVDPPRLPALERAVFGEAAPRTVVVTTPNAEHNVRFPTLPAGTLRHRDHRFEWTRAEFAGWAEAVGVRYRYGVRYVPVGPDDPEVGPPTQLAVFTKADPQEVPA